MITFLVIFLIFSIIVVGRLRLILNCDERFVDVYYNNGDTFDSAVEFKKQHSLWSLYFNFKKWTYKQFYKDYSQFNEIMEENYTNSIDSEEHDWYRNLKTEYNKTS